jgi:hypothetical protein
MSAWFLFAVVLRSRYRGRLAFSWRLPRVDLELERDTGRFGVRGRVRIVHAIIGHLFRVVTLLDLALNWITGEILDIGYDVCTCTGNAGKTFDGKYHDAVADSGQTPLRE